MKWRGKDRRASGEWVVLRPKSATARRSITHPGHGVVRQDRRQARCDGRDARLARRGGALQQASLSTSVRAELQQRVGASGLSLGWMRLTFKIGAERERQRENHLGRFVVVGLHLAAGTAAPKLGMLLRSCPAVRALSDVASDLMCTKTGTSFCGGSSERAAAGRHVSPRAPAGASG